MSLLLYCYLLRDDTGQYEIRRCQGEVALDVYRLVGRDRVASCAVIQVGPYPPPSPPRP